MSKIIDAVTELAGPIAQKHGCELWDVEYVKEAGNWILRVYIDSPDGVSIDNCETISRDLDPLLDEREDLFPDGYIFEVSSAGAERHLRRPSDFERFTGRLVEVKLYKQKNGQKTFLGTLSGSNNGDIDVIISGEAYSFKKDEIASVRLRIEKGV